MKKHLGSFVGVLVKSAKLLKSVKAFGAILSLSSMAVFGFVESWALGVALGLSLLALVFGHEMGHVLALKSKGYPMKLPFFVPFLGAVIFAPSFEDRETEAYVGLGGPLLGTLCAVLFAVPYYFTMQPLWLSASYLGLFINLFNMVPISPFDGGRITKAADPRLRYLGYALLLLFTAIVGEPGMLIIWMLVVTDFNWTAKRKLNYCRAIWMAMVVLTVLGVGAKRGANTVDCLCGAVVLSIIELFNWLRRRRLKKMGMQEFPQFSKDMHERLLDKFEAEREAEQKPPTDERPMPDGRTRALWFVLWASLAAIQFWVMHGEMKLMK